MRVAAAAAAVMIAACGGATPSSHHDEAARAPTAGGNDVHGGEGGATVEPKPAGNLALAARAMAGPFESLDAFCGQLGSGVECGARDTFSVGAVVAPFLAVEMITVVDRDSRVEYCDIAVRIDSGWFSTRQHQVCSMEEPRSAGAITAVSFATRDAGAPVVRISARIEGNDGDLTIEDETVVLCGLGASGVPKCTEPIVTYRYTLDRDGGEDETELTVVALPDGTVSLSGQYGGETVDGVAADPF